MGNIATAEQISEVFLLYPGLEDMIDTGYKCLSPTDYVSSQSLVILEPFLRHLIHACGLVHALAQITNTDGSIDLEKLAKIANTSQLGRHEYISLEKFKSIVVVTLLALHQIQRDDAVKWQNTLTKQIEKQHQGYAKSIAAYKSQYIEMIKSHYAEVDAAYKLEEEFVDKWNQDLDSKERLKEAQMANIMKMNDIAEMNLEERKQLRREKFLDSIKETFRPPTVTPEGVKKYNYMYPMFLTESNCPISAGSAMPAVNRRNNNKE